MKLHITFFAAARDAAGNDTIALDVPDACTVGELRVQLVSDLPSLQPMADVLHIAVNSEYAANNQKLASTDEIVCFPPVSGG